MTSLYDLIGAKGQYACPDCPKIITDELHLKKARSNAKLQIGNIIFEKFRLYIGASNELDEVCDELGLSVLDCLLKNLSVEEFISLKRKSDANNL